MNPANLSRLGAGTPGGVVEHPDEVVHPCSLAQERFWVLDRLQPGNPALNIAVRWRLDGIVVASDLEQAFATIVARHEILRSGFEDRDGALVQVVRPSVPTKLPIIDLTSLTDEAATAEMERASALEARTSFDLTAPPFLRLTLVRLGATRSVLLITIHHIVADGWSIGVLAEEMGQICSALRAGAQPALPPLSIGYGDYARRQRERLARADLDGDAAFWRQALTGMGHFALHTDFPRPAEQSTNGAIASILLPRSLTDSFAQLGRRNGCTLFMTALATLYTLLHRYSGETDIGIGTQTAGREDVDVEPLVGLFINTLVLRADLSGEPRFVDLLERTRDLVSDAFEHQQLPLERVIDIVAPKRDLSRNALFSVNFIFQRSFVENAAYGAFTLTDMPSRSAGALYDLNFFMVERPEGWRISCEYNTDLFEPATVDRFVGHFRNLMQAATATPDMPIGTLPMLSEAERQALLVAANATAAPYPAETLPELFRRQAAATPDAVAVTGQDRALTYAELDRASSRLATHLVRLGITQGLVGVMLDRSADLPVALLAILKAGAAYVPLDPTYPPARLEQIVEDAGLVGLITASDLGQRLLSIAVPRIEIDRLPDEAEIALPQVSADRPAYVIFTSGSTGRPKGVEIPHRALVNLLWAMRDRPGIDGDDVLLAVTTISFDIAALELFLPLIVGARMVIATAMQARDGRDLLALMARERVTILQATPATWELLIDAGWRGSAQLKMLCGGEALSRRLADRLLERGGELWNLYGPTETTIWSAAYRVESGSGAVPIGGPIANTQFYVVDHRDEPVPAGAPGELLIGGDGVATGYLGRDDLTAARFIPNKVMPATGGRLYRTGDVVRMRRPGEFEYLGRTDHQVKLRGFRIELGDIEATALAGQDIAEAVATVHRPDRGEPVLSLYIVPAAPQVHTSDLVVETLRRHLVETLPGYMQPQFVTPLERLPRTPNGKIDRQALPPPTPATRPSVTMPPLDATERRLADIWQEVLGHDTVDKDADFFELGGHSLLAARLLVRIEAVFGQKISLASLFRAPTLAAMARSLTADEVRQHDFRQVVRLQAGGTRTPVIGINNTGIYFTVSKRLGIDRPFTALQLFDPSFSRTQMPENFEAIAQQYVTLIREVQPAGPYALLGWCVGGALAFEVARQLSDMGEKISMLALIDTWAPRYVEDLGRIRGWLATHSYRWQLTLQDWKRKRNETGGFWDFVRNREFVRRLGRLFGDRSTTPDMTLGAQARYVTADGYDQWLLKYLQQAVKRYRPGKYSGEIVIFRSDQEPHGLFLDSKFGWRNHTEQAVRVVTLPGDHFTIFTEPGVDQMAQHITDHLEAVEARTTALPQGA